MTERLLFGDDGPLREEFEKFHAANPHVYQAICKLAETAIERGRTHYSIATIYEVVRWHGHFGTNSDGDFKLNNNHRAFYARLWLADHPERPEFFGTRVQRALPDEDAA